MTVVLEQGDVEERLRREPDASFDALLSDCPYGIGVSSWDEVVPGRGVWQEAARIPAPGAWLLVFGAPRPHHHLMVEMEEAGLEIRDVLSWLYATGFPKGEGLKSDSDGRSFSGLITSRPSG